MRCQLYRTEPARLIEALGDAELVRRYRAALAAELPGLADRRLLSHLRRLDRSAAEVLMGGLTQLARREPAAADALLTDLFAVATWHGWELPATPLGEAEADPPGSPGGLLGADPGGEGARLWLLDHATVALARARQADEVDAGHWGV